MASTYNARTRRVDWVDYAKGFCIIMVVMMHSTLGVEEAAGREGFMHVLVAFAKPFRMPDFFLISGLFLAQVIDRDWRTYLDRKVMHFAYFYVLWVTLQFALKAPYFASQHGWGYVAEQYALAFIDPFGTLWFIYLLPIFFVVAKATRSAPPWLIWLAAAALQTAHIETGWTAIDEFAGRLVFFYTGYIMAPRVFALAAAVQARPLVGILGLVLWALLNGTLVYLGFSELPLVSLALGLVGACAVVEFFGADGKGEIVRSRPLLRAAFDRHLSRLLPADGCDAHAPTQNWRHRRCRRDGADHHHRRRHRCAHDVVGGAQHPARLPVRAAGLLPHRPAPRRRCAAGGVSLITIDWSFRGPSPARQPGIDTPQPVFTDSGLASAALRRPGMTGFSVVWSTPRQPPRISNPAVVMRPMMWACDCSVRRRMRG